MRTFRRTVACMLTTAVAVALLPLAASPAGAVSEPQVIATGLNNPYKLTFGPDGALYVAEAGTGGDQCETGEGPEGEAEICFGETGSITRVGQNQQRVVTGIPSLSIDGSEVLGAHDVAFGADGATYVVVGLGGNPGERADPRQATILRVPAGSTTASVFADLGQFEADNNPDADYAEVPDSNPFGIESVSDGFLVSDAGGNSLLHVDDGGQIALRTVFPAEEADAPPFLGMPPGSKIPMQPVPTSVVSAPDGTIHVSQLTGFPFEPGAADVFEIAADGSIADSIAGFTNIIDIAFAPDGTLYVLEFSSVGLLNAPPLRSQLVEVRADGTRKVLLSDTDFEGMPAGGVTVGPDGMLYVTRCNAFCGPGAGTVIKVDPSVARDAATADACSPADVPGSGFDDIALSVHRESIECLKWWGVVGGLTNSTFGPGATINRAQAASLTANALEAAGVVLPSEPADAFSDDDDSVHELRINQLAAVGIVRGFEDGTFRPNQPVTRAQIVSLLVAAYELAADAELAAGPNAFSDDDGTVHEANINAAAAAGWVAGKTATTFQPGGTAERGAAASFFARWLSTLVSEGMAEPPA